MSILSLRPDLAAGRLIGSFGADEGWCDLTVTDDSVAADDLWRAVRALLQGTPGEIAGIEILEGPGLAVWDAETLGSPAPIAVGSDVAATMRRLRETHAWALVEQGRHLVGTPAAYVVARLTRGGWHAVGEGASGFVELCREAGVPEESLPEVVSPGTAVLRTDPSVTDGLDVPLRLL
ncbi:hypothetical protein GCM10027425_08330 [Alteromonas gracilis]